MRTHDKVAELLDASDILFSLGFREDIWYKPKGANHYDLIVITKALWSLPCSDAACGYEGVNLHFEYERPGYLLLHCELYPRKGSESKQPRERIQPLLNHKGGIATLIRDAAAESDWSSSIGWEVSGKNLADPKNLQVGKFSLGSATEDPSFVVGAIEKIMRFVVPAVDPIIAEEGGGER